MCKEGVWEGEDGRNGSRLVDGERDDGNAEIWIGYGSRCANCESGYHHTLDCCQTKL